MEPENFGWIPSGAGTASRLLGVFNERGTRLACHRIDAGAKIALLGESLCFVMKGSGEAAGAPWRRWSTLYFAHAERLELRAVEATEFVQVGFPVFDQPGPQRKPTGH